MVEVCLEQELVVEDRIPLYRSEKKRMIATQSKPQIIKDDLFAPKPPGSVLVVPVNAYVRNDGRAVMGDYCAAVAKKKFKGIDLRWGQELERQGRLRGNNGIFKTEAVGNHVAIIWDNPKVVAFPTKWHFNTTFLNGRTYSGKADLGLIDRSTCELVTLADYHGWQRVYMPRAGTGRGERLWEEVWPILEAYLDSRFIICIP